MVEWLELHRLSFNRSVAIETRHDNETGDARLLLALERAGVFDELAARLDDLRDRSRVAHSLADQLRTVEGLLAQGWNDLSDTDGQRGDPLPQVAASGARGLSPFDQSQPTLSRLLATLASESNRGVLNEATLKLAGQSLRAANRGHRRRRLTLDFDGMAISTAGHQAGSAYNAPPLRGARLLSADWLDRQDRRSYRRVTVRGSDSSSRRCAGLDPLDRRPGQAPLVPSGAGAHGCQLHR